MREEFVSSWVSDSFAQRSFLSNRQMGWKSAYGLIVSSDWLFPLSMRESSIPVKASC